MKKDELKMQAQFFQWHWNTYPNKRKCLFRIKNEMDNFPPKKQMDIYKQLSENKATGVVDGVSDMILVDRAVYFIELKTLIGRQSESQREFQRIVEALGHVYVILNTFEKAKQFIYEVYR